MSDEVKRLERESAALRACALKYLAWHGVKDPAAGLASDLRDRNMIGEALHAELYPCNPERSV